MCVCVCVSVCLSVHFAALCIIVFVQYHCIECGFDLISLFRVLKMGYRTPASLLASSGAVLM